MTLDQLQRIKKWHVAHRGDHPFEYHVWDAMLTMWMMGWVGWLPAFAFGQFWTFPLCAAATGAPSLYAAWRLRQHRLHKLRCDWLEGACATDAPS